MSTDSLVLAPILIPLTGAFLLPLVDLVSRRLRALFAILVAAFGLGTIGLLVRPVFVEGQVLVYWLGGWAPRQQVPVGISVSIDAWGLLMAGIIAVVGLACLIYSVVYMRRATGLGFYYLLILLLIASLTGFCLTGDLFNQFVWLEILSVVAFALTAFLFEERIAIEAAFKYLVTNSIAAAFIAVAIGLLYMQTGSLNLAAIGHGFQPTAAGIVAVGLLLGGYATKSGLVPWHFWVPDAYAASPAPVAALFSGALSKIGIYAIGRTLFTLVAPGCGSPQQEALLAIAAVTMLIASVQMVQQRLIRRILAYSSISQMGYITMGLAVGTPLGVAAAAMHAVNHALVETALFLGVGMVEWRANVRGVDEGGGLVRRMPVTLGLMVLAGLGLSGMPFFSGFVSKTMLEEAARAIHADWIAYVAIASSAFTFAGIARFLWRVFAPNGSPQKEDQVHEAPVLGLLSPFVLVALSIFIGVSPTFVARGLAWPATVLQQPQVYIQSVLGTGPGQAGRALQFEPPPHLFHLSYWIVPLIVLVSGSLLAYLTLGPETAPSSPWLRPLKAGAVILRRWHSGLVSDYAMWNAFGTLLLLAGLTIATA